jgi:hypothetical protein
MDSEFTVLGCMPHVVTRPVDCDVISGALAPVDITATPDGYDKNHKLLIMYFIDDPLVTDANSPCLSAAKLLDSHRSRFFGKPPYGRNDSTTIRLLNFRQLLLGTPFNH